MKHMVGNILWVVSWLLFCSASAFAGPDTLTQVSTIDALLNGVYDGQLSLKELMTCGDMGIGTFHALDGEMVMVDGEVFQVKASGQVCRPEVAALTPFAAVTFLQRILPTPLAHRHDLCGF